MIHPHYLAYFNWASGGPDQRPPRLIDSNLDWGQDLVALQKWWQETIPGEPIGLAYFGQINPSIFKLRGEPFDWFLPPVKPGTVHPIGTVQQCISRRSREDARPRILRRQRDVALRPAVAALRSCAAASRSRPPGGRPGTSRMSTQMPSGTSAGLSR